MSFEPYLTIDRAASSAVTDQPDPDASLGGLRSSTSLLSVAGEVTTAIDTYSFSSDDLIDSVPPTAQPGGFANDIGNYTSSASLQHWYRLTFDQTSVNTLGVDYVGSNDLTTEDGLALPDNVSSEVPPTMGNQTDSLELNGTDESIALEVLSTWGIGNAWTFCAWVRTDSLAATQSILRMGTSLALTRTAPGNSGIDIDVDTSGDLGVVITDDTTATLRKDYRFSTGLSTNTWYLITVTWDGTDLQAFVDGVESTSPTQTTDDSVAQSASRTRYLALGRGDINTPSQRPWNGQYHSAGLWDEALSALELVALAGAGDGDVPDSLDVVGLWLIFNDGLAQGDARQIAVHDAAAGTVYVTEAFSGAPAATDTFSVGASNLLYDDFVSAECQAGGKFYRMVALYNNSGSAAREVRHWIEPVAPGPINIRLMASDTPKTDTSGAPHVVMTSEDDGARGDIADLEAAGGNAFMAVGGWQYRDRRSYTDALSIPPVAELIVSNVNSSFILLEIDIEEQAAAGEYTYVLATGWQTAAGGSTPDFVQYTPIVINLLGFTGTFSVEFERTPRTFGGSRIIATLLDATTGLGIEGEDVYLELDAGSPGSLYVASTPLETDEDGDVTALYTAPEDEGEVGNDVIINARLGGTPTT